jgi:hypothetical protein
MPKNQENSLRHERFPMAQSWRKTSLRRHYLRLRKSMALLLCAIAFQGMAQSWRTMSSPE